MSNTYTASEQESVIPQRAGKKGNDMRKVKLRRFVSFFTCLIVMMGFAAAHHMSDYDYIRYYLDEQYGIWLDSSGDDYGDALGFDANKDGFYDAYRFSTLANGYRNVLVFDTSGNASFASARFYIDSNGTGRFNVAFSVSGSQAYVALDPEEDGVYTDWTSLNVASHPFDSIIIGGGQSSANVFATHAHLLGPVLDAMNAITNSWNAPACNGSFYGCR